MGRGGDEGGLEEGEGALPGCSYHSPQSTKTGLAK